MKRSLQTSAWLSFLLVGACGGGAELPVDPGTGGGTGAPDAGPAIDNYTPPIIIGESPEASDPCSAGGCDAGPKILPVCGDGIVNQTDEVCDDGNNDSGDGCTGNCAQVEANFACPTPGAKCVSTVKCGDGKIAAGVETCDDSNATPGDGCDASCKLEDGWECEVPGELCTSRCGDGKIVGDEECEFYGGATPTAGGGCAVDCRLEVGWDCSATAKTCAKTVCGNKVVERGESCDDTAVGGIDTPFDGCYKCVAEPRCAGGECMAVCGDGKRYNSEACDDGNIRDGDGCSKDCKVEEGYKCNDVAPPAADKIALPAIFRDFQGTLRNDARRAQTLRDARTAAGVTLHPDFNSFYGNGTMGVVEQKLGADRLPVYVVTNNPGERIPNFTGKANFDKWFRDDPATNRMVAGTIDLTKSGAFYAFDSRTTGDFFGPVDNKGFVPTLDAHASCENHNFSFTTQTGFWFEYGGGEQFDFSGDDDVWVFVNDQLVIDLGGLHSRRVSGFTLDATSGVAHVTSDLFTGIRDIDAKLKIGSVYSVAMFHAERQECESNFKLTLKDFNKPKSSCGPVCGDGVVTRGEVCDDGPDGNTGEYGKCMPGCKARGPYCGD
ncbi:MAG TPA: DUF4215 domain-containing protein, partial [Polyangiaceae bacterium]|nr:DUF4215 domain-containing protein [Polyangiaceae bacterium]